MNHYSDVLDEAALEALDDVTGGDSEFLAELVETFLEDAPILMNGIREAIAASDAGEVRRLAHGLKGNGNEFGATDFAQLCKTLEQNAANGQMDNANALLAEIEAEFSSVKAALEAYVES